VKSPKKKSNLRSTPDYRRSEGCRVRAYESKTRQVVDDSDCSASSGDDAHVHHHPAHDTSGYKDLAALNFMHLLTRLHALTGDIRNDTLISDLVRLLAYHIRADDRRALLHKLPVEIVHAGGNDFQDILYHYLLS